MPVEIRMPSLDPSMTEARVVKWLKAAGDPVDAGESIVEIETDKAVVDVESEAKGVLAEILVAEGDYAAINATIGIIHEGGPKAPSVTPVLQALEKVVQEDRSTTPPERISVPFPPAETVGYDTSALPNRTFASPLARRLAALEGLNLSHLLGSGPNGRIVKIDIEAALAEKSIRQELSPQSQSVETSLESSGQPEYELISNSAMRKTIARRLTESSRDIPHYFLTVDCELDKVLALRREVNETTQEEQKISLNDIIIRAVALALKKIPAANAAWSDMAILRFRNADISIAVAVDGGLITPVIRHADTKSLLQIAAEVRELAARARAGKLRPEEYKGGTFTVSNLGMFGVKSFTSIINPPQSAILSVGAGEQRPVVKDGQILIATIMTLTLAVDHRCIDGVVGAEFLAFLKKLIEQPIALLL